MFNAIDKDENEYMASLSLDKKEYSYICPACREYVFLKTGDIKIPHFAHYGGFYSHEWEGSSIDHYLMKKDIYNYFKDFEWIKSIKYERPVKENNLELIPDILIITKDDRKIAIECQVAKYSTEDLLEKTENYSKLGVCVLWIFHNTLIKHFFKDSSYFTSPFIKIYSDDDILKNIMLRRFYFYNNYRGKIYEDIIDYNDGNINMIHKNINDIKAGSVISEIENVNSVMNSFNVYFKIKRKPLIAYKERDNNEVKINITYDEQYNYIKNQNVVFGLDQIIYLKNPDELNDKLKSKHKVWLRTYYNSNINFSEYDIVSYLDDNYVLDCNEPNISDIRNKITYKIDNDELRNIFENIERIW